MSISVNTGANTAKIQVLRRETVVLEARSVELAELIDVANSNDCSFHIADEPGCIMIEVPERPPLLFSGIQCSTAHITENDNALLYDVSQQRMAYGDSEWIHFTGTGYLLRLSAWQYPILQLKRLGLSKACRRLVVSLIQRHTIYVLHLDAAGDVLPEFAIFDW